jgi:secretion/DNA translocation related TadE-like protein
VSRRPEAPERGAATLIAVALTGVLLMVGSALGVVGAMVVAHRKAQGAADLAALAGGAAVARGEDACASAAAVAAANDADLSSCVVAGAEVRVVVTVIGPRGLGQAADLSASARAGPGTTENAGRVDDG